MNRRIGVILSLTAIVIVCVAVLQMKGIPSIGNTVSVTRISGAFTRKVDLEYEKRDSLWGIDELTLRCFVEREVRRIVQFEVERNFPESVAEIDKIHVTLGTITQDDEGRVKVNVSISAQNIEESGPYEKAVSWSAISAKNWFSEWMRSQEEKWLASDEGVRLYITDVKHIRKTNEKTGTIDASFKIGQKRQQMKTETVSAWKGYTYRIVDNALRYIELNAVTDEGQARGRCRYEIDTSKADLSTTVRLVVTVQRDDGTCRYLRADEVPLPLASSDESGDTKAEKSPL